MRKTTLIAAKHAGCLAALKELSKDTNPHRKLLRNWLFVLCMVAFTAGIGLVYRMVLEQEWDRGWDIGNKKYPTIEIIASPFIDSDDWCLVEKQIFKFQYTAQPHLKVPLS